MHASTDLEESVVDMMSYKWVKEFDSKENVAGREMADIEPRYLTRYTESDREKVGRYLEKVSKM